MKHIILFLFLTGIAFSQVSAEKHQIVKDALVNMTIRWEQAAETSIRIDAVTDSLVKDLQAIENPSEELIAIMKKYQIYKEQ